MRQAAFGIFNISLAQSSRAPELGCPCAAVVSLERGKCALRESWVKFLLSTEKLEGHRGNDK